ncbi:hypothetical protein HDIA_4206 [Hartmannibacter diazotrophicus]|uniref:Uncharacterized protein n=1 Tax=Hartmannibacter diazotrophicus TaxID=1482074 RepID=A0A2C9DBR9_9HYPH|nr:DUF692 domain-containing protein [Hartmannibacter diazotrophicus]SON57747.1 hypothetical protein HDIA_4206 [Hartmannibacter diazotrophicus]
MSHRFSHRPVPVSGGIGLRSPHIGEMLVRRPTIGWLEVHAENYMGDGAAVAALERLRASYALSVHGVGLSLGSANGIDRDHLERLARVCERFEPGLVSEHLAWCVADGAYLNDLLPLRYDDEALAIVARNVGIMQDRLKRTVLIENLSAYLSFEGSSLTEAEFLAELVRRTGCGLLLDVNNVFVSAHNLAFDAKRFIDALPAAAIGEIHLAGHAVNEVDGGTILIDDHGSRVPPAVWSLYAYALGQIGPRPTLIEWDTDVPELDVLLGEAMWADMLTASLTFTGIGLANPPADARALPKVIAFEDRWSPRLPALTAVKAMNALHWPVEANIPVGERHALA